MKYPIPLAVETVFLQYPEAYREKLLELRERIYQVAEQLPQIGGLKETLKWGEPSYLPNKANIGSTVRIAWHQSRPDEYAMYFNCKTSLVETFKAMYGNLFCYGGNRAIIFKLSDEIPVDEICNCIAMTLTYHLDERT